MLDAGSKGIYKDALITMGRHNTKTILHTHRILFLSLCLAIFMLTGCQFFSRSDEQSKNSSNNPHQITIRIQLEGLEGDLQRNVRARLSRIQTNEISNDARFRARLTNEIRLGLKALGHYEPIIDFEFEPRTPPSRPVLFVRVNPGPPILLVKTDIKILGDAKNDPAFDELIERLSPEIGKPINHGQFDQFRAAINNLALNRGYFDATFVQAKLGISIERQEGIWLIEFDSGHRYKYGNITYTGSQIDDDFLNNLAPFNIGDPYLADDMVEFNRRLSRTNWFNSVIVTPDLDNLNPTEPINLNGALSARTKNSIDVGMGYSTDVGVRGIFTWRRPWWNSFGHSSETNLNISAKEQIADFNYQIPLKRNALDHYYLIQTGFKRQDFNDTRSDSATINVARFWGRFLGWQLSTNLRWSIDDFTQGAVNNRTMLIMPGVNVNRTRTVGAGMPTWGDTQRYSVDFSNKSIGSDIDFAILQAQYALIRTPFNNHRILSRANIGWIETNSFDAVPPSLRFFAGGDRSIRGYSFRSISPRDELGKLAGASQLATGSLEYQYNFSGSWWSATFIDAGNASNAVFEDNVKTGAGIGVRWASPVGPVRFDIATPINDRDNNSIQFYIGLGPEL
ncbi:autotransporter secretion outer membrane protein TamA [Thorsellia anophelis DSM 18579]|uniref:Translocation and assembly module subunit TamA n=2 Tax=Thorsellia anophelis TaxID=336804 RepID=A0A1H9ZNQ2_9GAMM|nr:autotransporter secretion outer membrane protein TamA [Thorsellia anophelis DSM 18579]